MTITQQPKVGTVGWQDLTVQNADEIRDFYQSVVGFKAVPLDMGGYADYVMMPPDGSDPVAGVCHARGENAGLPAQWLIYFIVDDVPRAVQACLDRGGEVLVGPKKMMNGDYCVIKDPAGAVCALYRP